jgi:DNA-directed RNA polymerase subunit beta
MTYAAPLKVTLRLIVFDVDEDTGAKSVKDIKEQDVFMGDMPLMTPNGTFIVNGTERVIVPDAPLAGRVLRPRQGQDPFLGQAAVRLPHHPYRGSWLDFEFDAKDIVFARIDRRRKLPVTTLLYALGLDQEGIMDAYYDTVTYKLRRRMQGWVTKFFPERVRGTRPTFDLVDADRRSDRRGRQEGHAARGQEADRRRASDEPSGAVRPDRWPLRRQGHHQRGNRRDLCRGR